MILINFDFRNSIFESGVRVSTDCDSHDGSKLGTGWSTHVVADDIGIEIEILDSLTDKMYYAPIQRDTVTGKPRHTQVIRK